MREGDFFKNIFVNHSDGVLVATLQHSTHAIKIVSNETNFNFAVLFMRSIVHDFRV